MNLQKQYPKAFEEWCLFVSNYLNQRTLHKSPLIKTMVTLDFVRLPFEMQFGVYLKYVEELDNPDIYIRELNLICVAEDNFRLAKEDIEEVFEEREGQLSSK